MWNACLGTAQETCIPRRSRVQFVAGMRLALADAVMPSASVLVVDDDELVRQLYSRALALEGHAVRTAATAQLALIELEKMTPDAILLDLRLPFINGLGLLYRLRAHHAHRTIPVAIITGFSGVDEDTLDELRALDAGVWYKPLSIQEILSVTRLLLSKPKVAVA